MNKDNLPNTDYEEIIDRDDFIDRFRAVDNEASIALWEYGIKKLVPILISLGFTRVEAEDLWKEVYVRFFERKCPTYDKSNVPFKYWARIVVKRAGLYELRKQKRLPVVSVDFLEELSCLEKVCFEKESGKREIVALVKSAAAQLTAKCQVALWQKFDQELPVDLIAENLGITEAAVRMRISRGLQELRVRLKGLGSRELSGRRQRVRQGNPSGASSA